MLIRTLTFVAASIAHLCSAHAVSILDSTGFEPPLYSTSFSGTGELEGQGATASHGPWIKLGDAGTAIVQSAIFDAGEQAVEVSRAANSDVRWTIPLTGYPLPGPDRIVISWAMRVEPITGQAGAFGPFFGVEAYDDSGPALGLLGSLGVDASTGDVLFQAEDTGFLTEAGSQVAFGVWHDYRIELDFAAKQYEYFLDGLSLGSSGFVDENNVAGGLNGFTDADIAAIAAAGDPASLALEAVAYFDGFLVTQEIPEPVSSLSAMAVLTSASAFRATQRKRTRKCAV